jgi:hypothetical protein
LKFLLPLVLLASARALVERLRNAAKSKGDPSVSNDPGADLDGLTIDLLRELLRNNDGELLRKALHSIRDSEEPETRALYDRATESHVVPSRHSS